MSTAAPALGERYGRPASPVHRRTWLAVAAVALLAALGWVVWAGIASGRADVRFEDVGFRIVSDQQVDVTFDVGKEPSRTASCTLQALDRAKSTVGLAQVRIGPQRQQVTRQVRTVRTSALAVTGVVRDCTLVR